MVPILTKIIANNDEKLFVLLNELLSFDDEHGEISDLIYRDAFDRALLGRLKRYVEGRTEVDITEDRDISRIVDILMKTPLEEDLFSIAAVHFTEPYRYRAVLGTRRKATLQVLKNDPCQKIRVIAEYRLLAEARP